MPTNKDSFQWIGGAGFLFSLGGKKLGVDLYLSDSCRRPDGSFKRLTPSAKAAGDIRLDCLISTHEHGDHFDVGSVPEVIENNPDMIFLGPGSVVAAARELGLADGAVRRFDRGDHFQFEGISIHAVFSDHGTESADAIGLVIEAAGRRIYIAGDTCFSPEAASQALAFGKIDLLIVPINGQFGNMDHIAAACFTKLIRSKAVVPCHYWLFAEHGGNPAAFVESCSALMPDVRIIPAASGEVIDL